MHIPIIKARVVPLYLYKVLSVVRVTDAHNGDVLIKSDLKPCPPYLQLLAILVNSDIDQYPIMPSAPPSSSASDRNILQAHRDSHSGALGYVSRSLPLDLLNDIHI